MEILKTKDYASFKQIMSNREVDDNHVRRLAKSIQRKNLLMIRPVIVNETMHVIDGQHRLAAAKQIGAEVHYLKVAGLNKSDIAILNSQQKNWSRTDFINFYALEGNQNYVELAKLIDKYYWLKPAALIKMATGDPKGLKDGIIKLKDMKVVYRTCEWLRELEPKFDFVAEFAFTAAFAVVITSEAKFKAFKAGASTKNLRGGASLQDNIKLIESIIK